MTSISFLNCKNFEMGNYNCGFITNGNVQHYYNAETIVNEMIDKLPISKMNIDNNVYKVTVDINFSPIGYKDRDDNLINLKHKIIKLLEERGYENVECFSSDSLPYSEFKFVEFSINEDIQIILHPDSLQISEKIISDLVVYNDKNPHDNNPIIKTDVNFSHVGIKHIDDNKDVLKGDILKILNTKGFKNVICKSPYYGNYSEFEFKLKAVLPGSI